MEARKRYAKAVINALQRSYFHIHICRKQIEQLVSYKMMDYLLNEDSSGSESNCSDSSSDDEVLALLCEAEPFKMSLGTGLNLDDLSPLECEQLLRQDNMQQCICATECCSSYIASNI